MKKWLSTFLLLAMGQAIAYSQTDYALTLNGTSDYGTLPQFFSSTAPTVFTVEWWLNPTSSSVTQSLSGGGTGYGWGAFWFAANTDSSVQVGTDLNTPMGSLIPKGTIARNQWQHLAFSFNNGTGKFYKNGILIATKTGMATPQNFNTLLLGCPTCGSQYLIGGMVDDIKIWTTERTASNIQSDMYATPVLSTTGLVGYWNFNDKKAGIATDSSGNGKNGTLNGCTYSAYTKPVFTTSQADYALTFNGTSDYGTLPQFFSSTAPTVFTVEWWLNPTSSSVTQSLSGGGTGYGWGAFWFAANTDSSVQVGTDLNTPMGSLIPKGTITRNQWQHLAFSFNNGTGKFYKNGILIATKTGMATPQNFNTLLLGCPTCGSQYLIGGMVDDIKIWSTERTASNIQSDMYATPVLSTTGLVGYWNFNDKKAGIATDSSGNGKNGTLNGCSYTSYTKPIFVISSDSITQKATTITSAAANAKGVLLETINIYVTNTGSGINIDTLNLDLTGTTNLANISNISIYQSPTGASTYNTSNKLSTIQPTSSKIALPLNLFITNSTSLWIVADISTNATANNSIKSTCKKVIIGGVAYYPKDTFSTATQAVTIIGATAYAPTEKTTGVIRNPGMGLAVYLEGYAGIFQVSRPKRDNGLYYPNLFWNALDSCGATSKASVLYIRLPWSAFEPTEGQYIWNTNTNYNALIQGAMNRGLKLAFRVYLDGGDSYQQATPSFVKTAGANGYTSGYPAWDSLGNAIQVWNPYYNDTIFLKKFKNFINAFGSKYNDPSIVEYVDAEGLGLWGEGATQMNYDGNQPNGNNNWAISTVANYYRNAFPKIILGVQNASATDATTINITHTITDVYRRDSYGSAYLSAGDKIFYASETANGFPVFAENCWNSFGADPTYHSRQGFASNRAMLVPDYNDVRDTRANMSDLRIPSDAIVWMQNSDLVDSLVNNIGYRLVATNLYVDTTGLQSNSIRFNSTWKNNGWGCFPNLRPAWNHKYKLAYALLDANQVVKKTFLSTIELGTILKESSVIDRLQGSLINLPNGNYTLAYAIVDSSNNYLPTINLAVTDSKTSTNWYTFGQININRTAPTLATVATTNNKISNSLLENAINCFPNPTKGLLHIRSKSQIKTIQVFYINGAVVYKKQFGQSSASYSSDIDISSQSKGMYIVVVEDFENHVYKSKVILN